MLAKEEIITASKAPAPVRLVPRCVRPLRYGRIADVLFCVSILAFAWLIHPYAGGKLDALLALVVVVSELGGFWIRWRFYGRHLRKICLKALNANLAICLDCGYSLEGLPESHRCPECGSAYQLAETKRKWKLWFATRRTGRFDRVVAKSIEQYFEASNRLKYRRSCVRCGHPLGVEASRICSECGAKHEARADLLLDYIE